MTRLTTMINQDPHGVIPRKRGSSAFSSMSLDSRPRGNDRITNTQEYKHV